MVKIYISNAHYGSTDGSVKTRLIEKGWLVFPNPYHRLLSEQELANWAKDATAIITATEPLTQLVQQSNTLKLIVKIGVGVDNIPFELCREKKIAIAYTPDAVTNAAAELAITEILCLLRNIPQANHNMHSGGWQRLLGREINEVVIGIIGWGRIGQRVTKLLHAFQPKKIIINDIINHQAKIKHWQDSGLNIIQTKLDELLTKSDIITLHADLNPSSLYLINKKTLSLMKKSALLVNMARGKLVNEKHLVDALSHKKIAGIALDVFEKEPYLGKFKKFPQALLTSHMGSFTKRARYLMDQEATIEVINFFTNQPLVNPIDK
ncbi:MAG: dehydrogenase [SAR324 cluster bacterium]|nr:dehydrogenase [SAR324 cluster bacterium]